MDDTERFSPVSTGSYSSGVSVPHMSGPGANDIERHHHQQRIGFADVELQSSVSTTTSATRGRWADTLETGYLGSSATANENRNVKKHHGMQQHRSSQQQQQHRHQLTVRHHQQLQQQHQQRHQLTNSLLMGRPLSSPATTANDLSEMLQQAVPAGYLLPCPLCDIPLEPRLFRQHLDRHYPRDSPVCPVLQCGRRFAHPNSVRNHMRIKHTLQWAKMKAMRSSGGPFSSLPEFK